jgi:hypothetical protein
VGDPECQVLDQVRRPTLSRLPAIDLAFVRLEK